MEQDIMFVLSVIPRIVKIDENYYVMVSINNEDSQKDIDKLKQIIEASGGSCENAYRPWVDKLWGDDKNNKYFRMNGNIAKLIDNIILSE